MKALILIFFLMSVSCQAQSAFDIQSQWDNDFMTSNWLPDTVICYDCETSYPLPFYEIKTYVVGITFEKIETGSGYYILVYNKYKSVWTERTGECFDWRFR